MNTPEINTVNVSDELIQARKLLEAFKKANKGLKKTLGGNAYKLSLEKRIGDCDAFIGQYSTANPNLETPQVSGSPNDGQNRLGQSQQEQEIQGNSGPGGPNDSIDPNLRNQGAALPSPKRVRGNDGQRYRKIVEENPLELVKDCISARMISRFQTGWLEHGTAVEAADPTQPAEKYVSLRDTAIEILDHVSDFVEEHKFSDAQFHWIEYDGGVVTFSLLTSLYNWLVTNELMVGNIQKKPVPRKVTEDQVTVKITDEKGKRITMSSSMLNDARINPSLYPGVVEEGMDAVLEVLKNRNGRVKCLTCDSTGLRGQALEQKPIPPQADDPYLKDCKCPLRGAALELWMVKMTAGIEGIPQRGGDIPKHRLALNPDILKVIGGAIEVASGLSVEDLLQPEMDRLEVTVHWALKRLGKDGR
ncbi:hypothetical protein MVEN_01801500 [Mycena venus]|uniref:Uncharacterized protein n=1 Tax=Mycena venus TaxID=2733690 RepID=A0A8H6XIH0_9AGAR|nr:hypothetical protein MVEN_01801500 [Mycena venus]